MFGNTLLEASPKKKSVSKNEHENFRRKPLANAPKKRPGKTNPMSDSGYTTDRVTGTQYREIKISPQETIVQTKYPNGEIFTWTKKAFCGTIAFSSEALTEYFKKDDFYESKAEAIREAISKQSIEELEEILKTLQDPQDFIHCCSPMLLRRIQRRLANAPEIFRQIFISFGCPIP
jgi:hypothetical protein